MPLGHHECQTLYRVIPNLVEVPGRVPEPEIPGPAAEIHVHLPDDLLDRHPQAAAVRELTEFVARPFHRFVRGPAGKEEHMTMAR